tara:strand:- start:824 stop:1657 length:834 start_codon:yes stop_codon:yes gene_type:complete
MRKILYLFTLLFTLSISSQDFQGQAFYKTQTAMDFGSWGDKMSAEQKKAMKERMKPFLEPVYILTFNKTKSIYRQEERLDAPGSGGGRGWGRMMASSGGPIYKDITSKKSLQSTEFMGKKFLISNDKDNINWSLEKETKMIGNYACFKATAMVPKPKTMTSVWGSSEKQNDSIKNSSPVLADSEFITITAWYTPMIAVSHGPKGYGGLPGLILELTTDTEVMLCTRVVMNPEKQIVISEPTKGEFVSRSEFENIVEIKVNEMRDMWRGGGSKSFRKN